MRRLWLTALALVALATPAMAQVNVVPQLGLTTGYLTRNTYSAGFFGLVPVSGGTDVVCIAGSATKTVRLQRIQIWGTTATAVQIVPVQLLRRVLVDTGGTAASTTANPANNVAKRDTSIGAATAVVVSYTANPTVNDASPTFLDSQLLTMPVVTSVAVPTAADFHFSRDTENLVQPPVLIGAAAQICVSLGGATLTNASAWNGSIVWTEE